MLHFASRLARITTNIDVTITATRAPLYYLSPILQTSKEMIFIN